MAKTTVNSKKEESKEKARGSKKTKDSAKRNDRQDIKPMNENYLDITKLKDMKVSELTKKAKDMKIEGVSGVHVMAYRQEEAVADIIMQSGVLEGRVPWYPGLDDQERLEA